MFCDCKELKEVDLSNFNTENVENMAHMFSGSEKLEKVNLSNFNALKADSLSGIFYQCKKLKQEGIITKDKKIIDQYVKDLED